MPKMRRVVVDVPGMGGNYSHIEYYLKCEFCGGGFWARRIDAKTCGQGCRKLKLKYPEK